MSATKIQTWFGYSVGDGTKYFAEAFPTADECEQNYRARTASLDLIEMAVLGRVLAYSKAGAEEAIRRGKWDTYGIR